MREAAAGDHVVEMRMKDERLPPRVEHGEEPDLGAQMLRVSRDRAEGLSRGSKQDGVHHGPVLERDHPIGSGTVKTTWKYSVSSRSASRALIHAARASD